MVKINLSGLLSQLEQTTQVLEELNLVHLLEPEELEEGFSSGKPLGYGARVSELLLDIRGLQKVLEVEEGDPAHPIPGAELVRELEPKLAEISGPIRKLREDLSRTGKELEETLSSIERLSLFQGTGLRLEDLSGYRSLEVVMGSLSPEGLAALEGEGLVVDAIVTEQLTICFIPADRSEPAAQLLSQHGFKPVEPPTGKGDPAELLAQNRRRAAELENELEALRGEREALATRHGNWLAAAEEYLAIEAGKSELPLRLTTSAHTFVLDGWVPERQFPVLEKALAGLEVHLEEDPVLELPGAEAVEGSEEASKTLVPPVKLQNPGPVRPMEFITKLFATPKHSELDPTALIFVTLPLFFGLMVSDLAYGLIYIAIGWLIVKKMPHNDELVMLGRIIIIGGVWTAVFGTILFTEAFGMHFSEIIHRFGLPDPLHLYHSDTHPIFDKFNRDHGLLKDNSVNTLLIISLVLGISHMTLAFIIGLVNITRAHGFAHGMLEKGSWLIIMWGLVLLIPFYFLDSGIQEVAYLGLGLLVVGCVLLFKGEGPMALMEIFSVISNGLSYLRLVAVGLADAALASLVNSLSGDMFLPIGILLWIVGHIGIVILGLLGSGINALRLQYVEFFPKFFEGGGDEYSPFGFKRTLIQSPNPMEAN